MTINEACIKVLKELGGRAPLKILCVKVQEIVIFKGVTPYNSICTELINHPKNFRRSPGKPKGWWELVSFQEEIATRDKRICELEAQLAAKDAEIAELKKVPTENAFVKRMIEATKNLFGVNRKYADNVRLVLLKLGRDEEQEELLAWIERREQKKEKKPEKKIIQKISNSQVFNGAITDSNFNGASTGYEE